MRHLARYACPLTADSKHSSGDLYYWATYLALISNFPSARRTKGNAVLSVIPFRHTPSTYVAFIPSGCLSCCLRARRRSKERFPTCLKDEKMDEPSDAFTFPCAQQTLLAFCGMALITLSSCSLLLPYPGYRTVRSRSTEMDWLRLTAL